MSISVLILTHNEEVNIQDCLDSVSWCDDVVVLDSGSTDRTRDIARTAGARVLERPFHDFATQRNFGIAHGGFVHDWIFHLDADERIPANLRVEMREAVTQDDVDAFRVAFKLMFRGRWLKRAGMYPVYQVRLGKKSVLRFEEVGHGQREVLPADRVATLRAPLRHEAFAKGIDAWRERHRRYADREAAAATEHLCRRSMPWKQLFSPDRTVRRRAAKALSWRLPCRPTMRFVYMMFLRGGVLDGPAGWTYCRLMAEYERMTDQRIGELRGPR